MDSSKDIIRENNYIFREIKQIGTRKIIPENIQLIENLAYVHEIKDIKLNKNPQQIHISNPNLELDFEIKLEGEYVPKINNEEISDNEINQGDAEVILESEENNNLIESIFEKLKNDENINDCSNIKEKLNSLKEEDKEEIIEGIKIKIENEEQENRFNALLNLLNQY